MLFLSYWWNFM